MIRLELNYTRPTADICDSDETHELMEGGREAGRPASTQYIEGKKKNLRKARQGKSGRKSSFVSVQY